MIRAADAGELLEIAVSAAAAAGRLLTTGRPPGRPRVVETKSSLTDVVTEMDRASERLVIDRIRAARPGDVFLGEEGGQVGAAPEAAAPRPGPGPGGGPSATPGGRVRWIIDPIDGTVNYLYGLPDWAVSIAAEQAGTVVAGVVHVPVRGEVFAAVRGGGAWLWHDLAVQSGERGDAGRPVRPPARGGGPDPTGRPARNVRAAMGTEPQAPAGTWPGRAGTAVRLHCAVGVPLSQALVATGFGYEAAARAAQGAVVAALLPRVRDIRRSGSCAVDLAAVAAGRVDAYYERGTQYWDHAAGGLIASEAGAQVGGRPGRPAGTELVVAAGPGLFARLQQLIETLSR